MAERTCIEPGCNEPAGTHRSPLWCAKHDEERIERITASMEAISAKFEQPRKDAFVDGYDGDAEVTFLS